MTLPVTLPGALRAAGLTVRTSPGWQNRGRPASTGGFAPVGILVHHTASSKSASDDAVVRLLVNGRSDLPGPLCQIGLARDGTVWMIAAGRANHAGKARASGTVAAGDGNRLYVGIEAFHAGAGERWTKVQYDAYVTLCAVLCREVTGNSAQTVRGHKETSTTGKPDPTFNMDDFRRAVAAEMNRLGKPAKKPKPKKRPKRIRAALHKLRAQRDAKKTGPVQKRRIRAAIQSLRKIKKR